MENKKHKFWRIILTGALSVLLLIPSCLWGTRPLYAEGEAPTKQTLGNMLITLLASFGVKTYIGVANSAQWVADNYEQFISTVSGLKSAYQIYEEVQSTYDPSTGKSTLSADAYNSIAQYVRNFMATYDVVDDSELVNVGIFKQYTAMPYVDFPKGIDKNLIWSYESASDSTRVTYYYVNNPNNLDLRFTYINVNGYVYPYYVSLDSGTLHTYNGLDKNPSSLTGNLSLSRKVHNNVEFYYNYTQALNTTASYYANQTLGFDITPYVYTGSDWQNDLPVVAYELTYGDLAIGGGELSDNIYYQGDQSLNDMVSTTDQNAVFDWSKVAGIDKTLAEILEAVNEIALTDAWDTVNFPVPDAKEPVPSVPVPDNTPIPPWWDNIPELEAPTCPTLSACIVSGARAVSDNITSLMNLHSELAIYTGVGLSLGLALLIIGAFRR